MKSLVVKHSIIIGRHRTSVSLEETFWTDLKEIARAQEATVSKLVTQIDGARQQSNLVGNPTIRTRTHPWAKWCVAPTVASFGASPVKHHLLTDQRY